MSATPQTARSPKRRDCPAPPHGPLSLVLLFVSACAATTAGALGPVAWSVLGLALAAGAGRLRGWRVAGALSNPRWFAVLAAIYVPVFAIDLLVSLSRDPVLPLARLVAFLAVSEALAGSADHPHRPLLLGSLLMIVAAAETTDLWFALPLLAFTVVACASLIRITTGDRGAPDRLSRTPWSAAAATGGATLALGLALFVAIPHDGAGWGSRPTSRSDGSSLATGLADEVRLGAIGRVKKLRTIALRARVTDGEVDPETVYWRARAFETWTGDGWRRLARETGTPVQLRAGRRFVVEGGSDGPAATVMDVRLERPGLSELVLPGRVAWLEPAARSTVALDDDGNPIAHRGAGPRRYRLGLHDEARTPTLHGGRYADTMPESVVAASPELDASVRAWAEGVARDETRPGALAQALVDELSDRPYSLDTTAIDPARPIASFLAGAAGHCEYFASSMVLALRHRGVHARVVGGYLGADRIPLLGELVVREERAHLWVEAWIPGSGWVRYDPTPAAGRAPASSGFALLSGAGEWLTIAWDTWVIGLDLGDQQRLLLEATDALVATVTDLRAMLMLLASVAAALGARALWRRARRVRRRHPAGVPRYYRRMVRRLARLGLVPGDAETSREFVRRAGRRAGDAGDMELVTALYERERFGGMAPSRGELARAERALERLPSPADRR